MIFLCKSGPKIFMNIVFFRDVLYGKEAQSVYERVKKLKLILPKKVKTKKAVFIILFVGVLMSKKRRKYLKEY